MITPSPGIGEHLSTWEVVFFLVYPFSDPSGLQRDQIKVVLNSIFIFSSQTQFQLIIMFEWDDILLSGNDLDPILGRYEDILLI